VRHQLLGDQVDVATHQRVHDLAHRQHDPTQMDQALAQLEAAALHIVIPRVPVVEQQVLELFDLVVE
jgi:hypothetical protein